MPSVARVQPSPRTAWRAGVGLTAPMDLPDLSPRPGDLDPIETASREELATLQLSRLQASLRRAYEHVPHYRRAFDDAGVRPEDCRALADRARFPVTTTADL